PSCSSPFLYASTRSRTFESSSVPTTKPTAATFPAGFPASTPGTSEVLRTNKSGPQSSGPHPFFNLWHRHSCLCESCRANALSVVESAHPERLLGEVGLSI